MDKDLKVIIQFSPKMHYHGLPKAEKMAEVKSPPVSRPMLNPAHPCKPRYAIM
jgi:hypothetical protein